MEKKITEKTPYISNPFLLAHQASLRLWAKNRGWAILLIILGALSTLSSFDGSNPSSSTSSAQSQPDISFSLIVFVVSLGLLVTIAALVFATYFTGILSFVTLKSENGEQATLKEALTATRERFWQLLASILLAMVKILGWTLLFIVPGIIAAVRYSLLGYVVMDGKNTEISAKESHERIKHITKGRLWEVFGVAFTGIAPFIGTLYSTAGSAALYKQLKTYFDKNLEKPKIHPLNYLLPIIFLVLVLIAAAFFAGIMLVRYQG